MITALDSNILIDLLGVQTPQTAGSVAALDAARMAGALLVCPVVVAEISAYFDSADTLADALRQMEISISGFSLADSHRAGVALVGYRRRSGRPKDRVLADFLVGAHALHNSDALLTRDRGYYRTYFPELNVIEPTAG